MNDKITVHTRLAVLKHLVKGKSPEVVAAAEKLSRFEVIDIASNHGYPDPSKMAKAVEMITQKLAADERDAMTAPPPPASPTQAAHREGRPHPATPRAVEPPAESVRGVGEPTDEPTNELARAVEAGKKSSSKRIKALAERIEHDVVRLLALLEEEESRLAAARREAAAKAELKQKKAQLERELATIKAQLRGGTSQKPAPQGGTSDGRSPAKEIRAWARSAGVDCPATGRVPQSVHEAYAAAHADGAAA